jgi:hypothetical protein
MNEIIYPELITYYIAYTDALYTHGVVDIGQCMATGEAFLDIFTDYDEYVKSCYERGIDTLLSGVKEPE